MIDINQIRDIQRDGIGVSVEKIRNKKFANLENISSVHASDFNEFENSKKIAECELPKILTILEKKIKVAASSGRTSIYFVIPRQPNDRIYMHIMVMLFSILPLNGFVCDFRTSTEILISW